MVRYFMYFSSLLLFLGAMLTSNQGGTIKNSQIQEFSNHLVREEKSNANLVIQTICGIGIRVSELRYFTVEAVQHGKMTVRCSRSERIQGLSPQFAQALCPDFLRHRKGHCQTCRHSGSQQHQYHTDLYYDYGC